ncbi:Cytochrome P450 89A2 [Nymphaea thermarum]|nr:Cytochrome P450 89A2 [Nymphaea thermarum]
MACILEAHAAAQNATCGEAHSFPRLGKERCACASVVSLEAFSCKMALRLEELLHRCDSQIQAKLHEEIRTVAGEDGEVSEESVSRMPYLKAVIMEALRRHPPGHFVLPHTVTEEEVSLNGYSVPKDATINFMVGEMGLDGKVWKQPLEFRPERFLPGGEGEDVDLTGSREIKMMPFGVGRRICPGMGLAMLHLQYFVANMVREFEWSVPDGEPVDLTEKVEFTVVMKNPLRAKIESRKR